MRASIAVAKSVARRFAVGYARAAVRWAGAVRERFKALRGTGMAERTLSIVIDVDGAERGAGQIRRMRSALDDLAGGGAGMERIVKHGRELSAVFREIGGVVSGS